ncbi:hypothetical protein CONPUDRAFT_166747, partial [Coniophora puteana RWD-64-598 SS2]
MAFGWRFGHSDRRAGGGSNSDVGNLASPAPSKGGRIILIDDAAHPFFPTSAQGASQAIEGGVTLAVLFQLAGKQNVPVALQAWEKIRSWASRRVTSGIMLSSRTRARSSICHDLRGCSHL